MANRECLRLLQKVEDRDCAYRLVSMLLTDGAFDEEAFHKLLQCLRDDAQEALANV